MSLTTAFGLGVFISATFLGIDGLLGQRILALISLIIIGSAAILGAASSGGGAEYFNFFTLETLAEFIGVGVGFIPGAHIRKQIQVDGKPLVPHMLGF